jgi:hypothetical protein
MGDPDLLRLHVGEDVPEERYYLCVNRQLDVRGTTVTHPSNMSIRSLDLVRQGGTANVASEAPPARGMSEGTEACLDWMELQLVLAVLLRDCRMRLIPGQIYGYNRPSPCDETIRLAFTTQLVHASGFSTHCSGALLVQIWRAALLGVALGTPIVLATGCSSTGTAFNARLISPVPTNPQPPHFDDDHWSQPSRSPAFDSDLFGG